MGWLPLNPSMILDTSFSLKLNLSQGHREAEMFGLAENPRTSLDIEPMIFLACSTVPQPTLLQN
jgi:hypothetical protein